MKEWHILNLGAGVQSTTVYLLSMEGQIPRFDVAIFADTQEEPEAVYQHLEWLKGLGGPPILVRTIGKLGDDLVAGRNAAGHQKGKPGRDGTTRFASIPAFTAPDHQNRQILNPCETGRVQRQCTRDYKVDVVEQTIRREILKLEPRQRVPKDVVICQYFGISFDERRRRERIEKRFETKPWAKAHFPLLDPDRYWSRDDCKKWLKDRVPHEVPRSACVF